MYVAAHAARRPLYVFSCLYLFVFDLCAGRDLCHNGTCAAWDLGARAPGPGGLGGWKPPRVNFPMLETNLRVMFLIIRVRVRNGSVHPLGGA